MKTKLLLLLLVATSFANAQVTNGLIQEFKFNNSYGNEAGSVNFASNSGTSFVTDRLGNSNSAIEMTMQTAATMTNIPSGTSSRTFSFWYKVSSNTGFPGIFAYGGTAANTKFGMYLGTTGNPIYQVSVNDVVTTANLPENVWRHFTITYTSGQVAIYINGVLLTSFASTINTTYAGLVLGNGFVTTTIDDFKIFNRAVTGNEASLLAGNNPENPIAEYDFNNTLNNTSGTNPFSTVVGVEYGPDRNGNANSALQVVSGTGSYVTLGNIPQGNAARSISLWIKPSQVNNDNVFFTYGDIGTGNCLYAFGGSFNPSNIYNFTLCGNNAAPSAITVNEWKHVIMTHNGNTSKVYINGILTGTVDLPISTNGTNFFLGSYFGGASSVYRGSFDDLKIFNYELTQTQVTNLFTNNTLSSQNFNQSNLKVTLYPNPAKDILNIALENEIQSVEIYSFQGQKVMTSTANLINVSSLSKGMYLVKVMDTGNNSASQKLIVK